MNPTLELEKRTYRVDRFRVRVAAGPDATLSADSRGLELTIGTDPTNDLKLSDPTASRHHCALEATPDGVRLRDLGSTNGVLLAGCRIEAATLAPGASFRIGASQIVFEPLADSVTEPVSDQPSFGTMLGSSVAMRRLFAMLPRIASSDSTVLIEGDTGTGKTLLAQMIHDASPRRDGPFVVVDCSAIAPSVIESELFGHEKGAFTGALARRIGLFESAQQGTVFLDEIGELPLEVQAKLLRVLEERVVRRVGGIKSVPVDVRVIAATNRDLRQAVNAGTFRSDLRYRLDVIKLTIPPLRERREDIAELIQHFHRQFSPDGGNLPAELVERLCRMDWSGNVRELRGAVERAVVLGDPIPSRPGDAAPDQPPTLDGPIDWSLGFRGAKNRIVAYWERRYLGELMDRNGGNLSQAAREARLDRNYLRELIGRRRAR